MNKKLEEDMTYVRKLLPSDYVVKESANKGNIRCVSQVGLLHKIDADDDEHWEYIVKAIKQHFGIRFQEIDHNVNFGHKDFTLFIKPITTTT